MIGKVLGGRYEIKDMIDSGGMAYVYRAFCKKTDETVAVKVLREEFAESEEYVNRFKKEAEAAFAIDHKNVVRVTDIGYDQGVYYMVMEYIEGPSLKTVISDKKRLDEKEAIDYMIQACGALAVAHKKGIIHRDIKPQNMLLSGDGLIKITDFGIAKSVSSVEEKGGQVIGSVHYISPEQAMGGKVDERTDIYSMGIVLYEMLTGELPYTGEKTVSVALKHINEQITAPAEKNTHISKAINSIVLKATSKNKRDRYQTMLALKQDLVRALANPDGVLFVSASGSSAAGIFRTGNEKRNRVIKICILALLIVLVLTAVIFGADALFSKINVVSMPNTVSMSEDEAVDLLKRSQLSVSIAYENSETIAKGIVISQSPAADAQVKKDDVVYLVISDGPAAPTMPDIVGMNFDEAKGMLEEMGLMLEEPSVEVVEGKTPGEVISQMPEAGSEITGHDVVTLVVAGEEIEDGMALPQITGMPVDQAVALLQNSGFLNIYIYQEQSEELQGTVIRQSPEQGMQTPYSSDVDLWISEYTDGACIGYFRDDVAVAEKESKVKIVFEDTISEVAITFVVREKNEDAGTFHYDIEMESQSAGVKTVRVLVNNIEVLQKEVEFVYKGEFE